MQKWDCVWECEWMCMSVHWHTNATRRWDETRTQTRNSFYYYYLLIHAHTITHPKCSTVWMPTLRTDLSCNQCVGPLNFCALSIRQPPLQITQNEIQKNHDRLLNVWKTFLFHFNYFFFFPLASIEMFVYLFSRMPNFFIFIYTRCWHTVWITELNSNDIVCEQEKRNKWMMRLWNNNNWTQNNIIFYILSKLESLMIILLRERMEGKQLKA